MDEGGDAAEGRAPLSPAALAALSFAAILIVAGLVALGTWQLERRTWKLDLIARVEQRVHAPAVDPPTREEWPRFSAARDEYRHVDVAGTFLHDRETLVQASTVLGSGHWVLTPLRSDDGTMMLVNRGFVTLDWSDRASRVDLEPRGTVVITGLLRVTEAGGGFLRRNDPASNRWYSRDVQSIATARGLSGVAPYFIDAAASSGPRAAASDEVGRGPVGGLTVIDFPNSHLVYAITWYALASMVTVAAGRMLFEEKRLREGARATKGLLQRV